MEVIVNALTLATHDAIPPAVFRRIQPRVRRFDQRFCRYRLTALGGTGDTDADGDRQIFVYAGPVICRYAVIEPLCDVGPHHKAGLRQGQNEFFAAITRGEIGVATILAYQIRERVQGAVPDGMAKTIIHTLEVINIDHQQCHRLAAAERKPDHER